MTQQERRGWLIVASLFVVLLLIAGSGANTFGVFVPALLKSVSTLEQSQGSTVTECAIFLLGRHGHPGWMAA
jgi:hypothetical protein